MNFYVLVFNHLPAIGFTNALHKVEYFYKIPMNSGNFDVMKDLYKGQLVPVRDIPDVMMKMMKTTLPRITRTVKRMSLSKLISLVFFF